MKKIIYKFLIFISIIIVCVLIINTVYIQKDTTNYSGVLKFQSVPSEIEICNFGSSHGFYGFNYEDVANYTCFNFGLTSQRLSYDYRILYYYQDKIGSNAIVFIPISYASLFGQDETVTEDFLSKNKRYYKFLPPELIKKYDIKTDFYERYFPSLVAYGKLWTVFFAKQDGNEPAAIKTADEINVEANAMSAYTRHIVNHTDEDGNWIVNQEELNALYSMIDLCRELDATPILVTTPYLAEYIDAIEENSPEFYTEFYGLLDRIIDEKGVAYYDFKNDERFCADYSLFSDADHLNKNGAKKFVEILLDEVDMNSGIN